MTEIKFDEQLKMLIELQKIDFEIFSIKTELATIPDKIKIIDDTIKEKENLFKSNEELVKKLQLKRKDKEVELGGKEEAIKKHQAQLFQLKTNQEYAAMQKEINSLGADKSVLEEAILVLFDEIDAAEKAVNSSKAVFQQEKAKLDAEKKKIDAEKNEMQSRLDKFLSDRGGFTAGIDKNILARYERILSGKDGQALVEIKGDACGGCNMNLPPQVVNETKMRVNLVICSNCSRILYTND